MISALDAERVVRDPGRARPAGDRRVRALLRPATIHATCEDYRAGATIDLAHDRADIDHPVACPTLALWSHDGIGRAYDVPGIWRRRAPRFTGQAIDCGHFLAEERPRRTAAALLAFLSGKDGE